MIQVIAAPSFQRKAKKLRTPQRAHLNEAIQSIQRDPFLGEAKVADLQGYFVCKFKLESEQMLIAYKLISEELLKLLYVGPHENFYRDLKRLTK